MRTCEDLRAKASQEGLQLRSFDLLVFIGQLSEELRHLTLASPEFLDYDLDFLRWSLELQGCLGQLELDQ